MSKPYQKQLLGYTMKDGRVFLAKCSPKFYGYYTPGFIIGEEGETLLDNSEFDNENPVLYGLLCLYKGTPVGIFNGLGNVKSGKKVTLILSQNPYTSEVLTYTQFNKKVKKVWEPVQK